MGVLARALRRRPRVKLVRLEDAEPMWRDALEDAPTTPPAHLPEGGRRTGGPTGRIEYR